MTMPDDGGAAFPVPGGASHSYEGMTLRDYFAGQALQGLIAGLCACDGPGGRSWTEADQWAPDTAYRVADAMLERRKR